MGMPLLSNEWIAKLKAEPETGMGYHLCNIIFKDGRKAEGVLVFNCEQLHDELHEYDGTEIEHLSVIR